MKNIKITLTTDNMEEVIDMITERSLNGSIFSNVRINDMCLTYDTVERCNNALKFSLRGYQVAMIFTENIVRIS